LGRAGEQSFISGLSRFEQSPNQAALSFCFQEQRCEAASAAVLRLRENYH
jgi:hypothetical protein